MTEQRGWLLEAMECLRREPQPSDADAWGERLHEALTIAEVEKYATEKSRFEFSFSQATEEDVAAIRRHLSPLENKIVEIIIA